MLKTFDSEGVICYDRATIKRIYGKGFHLINDLVPLYHMLSYLKKYEHLSQKAKLRLKWFDYHYQCENVSLTCRHFGISRKTFYKWQKKYEPNNLYTLEDESRAPLRRRQREITPEQKLRIIQLRKKYIRYSKIKLAKIYLREYEEPISSWKIQKVIEQHRLYSNPRKTARITHKRLKAIKKKRITELKKRPKNGFLLCLDAIELRWNNLKRYIFTGIDYFSKVAFARMYQKANSFNATDFLNRLLYLTDGKIENIQTDNGSEFEKYFNLACQKFQLVRYYNRPRTPKDNPVNERFNQTLEDEFIKLGNFTPDIRQFNKNLTEWLIEYNFRRPHQSLNYETPINFNNSTKVLPMYPSSTPAFSTLQGSKDREKLEILFARSIKYIFLTLGLIILIVGLFAEDILGIWLGADFALESTAALQVLALGVLINSLAHTSFALLQGVGRPDLPAKFHLLELPLYVGSAWLLIGKWGITGAAVAWTLRVTLDTLLLFTATFKVYKLSPRTLSANGVGIAGFMFGILAGVSYMITRLTDSLQLPVQILLIIPVFGLFGWVCWRYAMDVSDRRTVMKVANPWNR